MSAPRRNSLLTHMVLAHLLVIVVATATLLVVTLLTAAGLHDRLMVALLGPELARASDPSMAAMEQATNAVFQTAMLQALLISGVAASLVAVVVSLLLAGRMVQPIRQLLAASRRIAAGHYNERVQTGGSDELAALALQFNTMAHALDAAERRRVALVGDVAHELRTPLATIAGYAEGALDGVVAPDMDTWALILDEVSRLRRLVDDLQELSRAEARQLPLQMQPVIPAELVGRAIARLAPQYNEKGVHLETALPPGLPAVLADPDRMTQVLINLLGNALQYTPAKGVVMVRALAVDGFVQFVVHDNGVGIAAEHLPQLFERFYRVDKARARATGGTGIGLTICKALVEAHDGQIWAASAGPAQGATFSFTLPRWQPA